MKKILILALLASLCLLCGCQKAKDTDGIQAPTVGNRTEAQPTEQETLDWEMPVDVDENTEETGAVTEPGDGTEAADPEGTKPVTQNTEPKETEPEETKSNDGAIVLPYIPG